MSIRFSNPEIAYFLEHQVMNDNWEKVTKIILWSIQKGLIIKIEDKDTGKVTYDCLSKTVEDIIRKQVAFGRGSFFSKQHLETQAILAAVIDPDTDVIAPPPRPKTQLNHNFNKRK